ncbi:MAG: glycosyltransferase family 2 protein [Syntrophales bacterium]
MISLIVPAYNEAASIKQTIEKIRQVMDHSQHMYELLVVDDGSADETAQIAETCDVRVIRHPANSGYGNALKTGLQHSQYDWCAIVDADESYPLDRLPDLIGYIPEFDMVVGARTGANYWGHFGKRIARTLLLWMISFVIGRQIPDANSGMRVFRKDIALAHIRRISSGFSFTTTITLAFFLEGHFVKYVPISYLARTGKSKVKLWIDSLRTLQMLVQAILYYNPAKLFLMLCICLFSIGTLSGLLCFLLINAGIGIFVFVSTFLCTFVIGAIGLLAEAIRLYTNK